MTDKERNRDARSYYEKGLEYQERTLKKLMSHMQLIPSEDFTTDEYEMYLEHASAGELNHDVISKKTYDKISLEGFFLL